MKNLSKSLAGLMVLAVFFVTGCESVDGEKGMYEEGTYFGYSENGYTATVYVNENGLIKSVFIDAAYQNDCLVDEEEAKCATTKQILGEDYGMTMGGAPLEWFEQATLFGKKVVEQQNLDFAVLYYKDAEGNLVEEDPEVEGSYHGKEYMDAISGVTMAVEDMVMAVTNALDEGKVN